MFDRSVTVLAYKAPLLELTRNPDVRVLLRTADVRTASSGLRLPAARQTAAATVQADQRIPRRTAEHGKAQPAPDLATAGLVSAHPLDLLVARLRREDVCLTAVELVRRQQEAISLRTT